MIRQITKHTNIEDIYLDHEESFLSAEDSVERAEIVARFWRQAGRATGNMVGIELAIAGCVEVAVLNVAMGLSILTLGVILALLTEQVHVK